MDYLPIFADLKHRPCVVVGGDTVAWRKTQMAFLALFRASCWLYLMAKSLILDLRDAHHLFPITAPTNALRMRFSSRIAKSHISSIELPVASQTRPIDKPQTHPSKFMVSPP